MNKYLALFLVLFLFSDVYEETMYASPAPATTAPAPAAAPAPAEEPVPAWRTQAAWEELSNEVFIEILRETVHDPGWDGMPMIRIPDELPYGLDFILNFIAGDEIHVIVIPEMKAALLTGYGNIPPDKVAAAALAVGTWADPAKDSVRLWADGGWSTCWLLEMGEGLTARQLAQVLQDIWKCHQMFIKAAEGN